MIIGIAGGVGSGKSTVLSVLEKKYGATLCMADNLGHEVMKKGMPAYDEIVARFGTEIVEETGEIHRGRLAEIVYGDSRLLKQLNDIVHPQVLSEIRRLVEQVSSKQLFILESALLFETDCDSLCDEVWGILAQTEIRIQRLMENRGYSRQKARDIMEQQLSDEELIKRCDVVIRNDGSIEELESQLEDRLGQQWY